MLKIIQSPQWIFTFYIAFLLSNISATAQTTKVADIQKQLKHRISDTTRLRLLQNLSAAYSSVDPEKKFYYASRMKELAQRLKKDSVIADAYLDMGISYGIRSKMDSALYYFSLGHDKAKAIHYKAGIARSLTNIGFTYDRLDNKKDALKNYLIALPIFKKLKNNRGIAQCYTNIGAMYFDLGEYKPAERYFTLSLKTNTLAKDEVGIGASLFSLGNVNKKLGNLLESRNYYEKSLVIREKIGDLNGIGLAKWGIGTLDLEEKKYDKAIANFEIALKNDRIIQDTYHECAVLISMANAYLGKKDYKKAEETAKLSLSISKKLDSQIVIGEALEVLVNIYKAKKDFEQAFNYQTNLIITRDSILQEKTIKELMLTDFKRISQENDDLVKDNHLIATKNTGYFNTILIAFSLLFLVIVLLVLYYRKNLEKMAVNKLLERQKEEIANFNEELEALNEEINAQMAITSAQNEELEKLNMVKSKFFSIVSHDLRGPLSSLKMLFGLYKRGQMEQEDIDELLARLGDTIYTMSGFLDNLLEWSKSQLEGMTVNPSAFNIVAHISENIMLMDSQIQYKGLKIENKTDEPVMVYADPNMINVVIRNLLSNSIKFCNTGDIISLNVETSGKKVILSISDTGPGIKEKDKEKLFSLEHTISTGTYGEKGHQIGLILCKDMVEQNNGKIRVESELGKGTFFWVELPQA